MPTGSTMRSAVALVGATAVGISAAEHSATKVSSARVTPAAADLRLNEHQQAKRMFLGQ
jgi:hypothetical protein